MTGSAIKQENALKPEKAPGKSAYHHGDLRRSLMTEAIILIREHGIEGLSLRKLAERVGVSQTAIYHHFKDKQALLGALGIEGILQFGEQVNSVLLDEARPLGQRFEEFVMAYVRFAMANPELYELMFGRTTWKLGDNAEFKRSARAAFRRYGEGLLHLQVAGALPGNINPLRLAQVAWATMHGLCRMYNDGLAFTSGDVEEITRYAVGLMRQITGTEATR
jgi:AcrR family transcriptional regulator